MNHSENGPRSKRELAIFELLQTEQTYLTLLTQLHDYFYLPLVESYKSRKSEIDTTYILHENDIKTIFTNFDMIRSVNTEIFNQLKNRLQEYNDTTCIGDIFLLMADYLKIYKTYCFSFNNSTEVVNQRLQDRAIFANFVETTASKLEGKQTLSSYLILPIQRIPRYLLLLDAIKKSTDFSHPDYNNIDLALQKIKSVTEHVNQSVTTEEHRAKIVEIQNRFVLNTIGLANQSIIKPHRKLVHEGVLSLEHSADLMFKYKLYCYLFNDMFAFARIVSSKAPFRYVQELKAKIKLTTAWIIENTEDDNRYLFPGADKTCFGILSPQGCFMLRCKSVEERLKWTQLIVETISNLIYLRESYLHKRMMEFPYFKNGAWSFVAPSTPNFPVNQMARHMVIQGSPPPYLVHREKIPQNAKSASTGQIVKKPTEPKQTPPRKKSSIAIAVSASLSSNFQF